MSAVQRFEIMPLAMELDSVQQRQSSTSGLRVEGAATCSGWLKRWSRWEFWPPYLFYPPVVAYIAYLGIRFRSWTLFTAANPAIPASGFVGESKHQILEHLKNAAPDCLLPFFWHAEYPPDASLRPRSS